MMRNKFILFCLLAVNLTFGGEPISSTPSFFYTKGLYSGFNSSNSYAWYAPVSFSWKANFSLSYENLSISGKGWNYKQQFGTVGYSGRFDNFIIKANYGHIKGDYNLNPNYYISSDYTNLLAGEVIYNYKNLFWGAEYIHQNVIGFNNLKADHYILRFENIFNYNLYGSIRPAYVRLTDGRSLLSISGKIHYLPLYQLLLKAGGHYGNRAYYFDNDLLTIYNQNDTQKYSAWLQAEYAFIKEFALIASFQHSAFTSYSINYYIAGVKVKI